MKKEKVIIWGMGSGYRKRAKYINDKCDILAYTGNSRVLDVEEKIPFIESENIREMEYDKIIICSVPYYYTIKYQLLFYYHILPEKIASIMDYIEKKDEVDRETEQTIFQTVEEYNRKNRNDNFRIDKKSMWLLCEDYADNAGTVNKQYFMQDIWAAKKIYELKVKEHYDIGSRVEGFLSHILVFCENVHYIDIRPLRDAVPGLHFVQGDATNLENIADNSIESLSTLHAIEHFGLGRYGDIIDPDACFKAINSLQRVLKPGGKLYFSVPVGPQDKLVFNAHRIFNPTTIIKFFSQLSLKEFSYVYGTQIVSLPLDEIEHRSSEIKEDSSGLFVFEKENEA